MSSGPATRTATTLPAQTATESGSGSAPKAALPCRTRRPERQAHALLRSALPGTSRRCPSPPSGHRQTSVYDRSTTAAWTTTSDLLDSELDTGTCPVHLSPTPLYTRGDLQP